MNAHNGWFKVVRMVVIWLYVRNGSLYNLCNGSVTIVGDCVKMSAIYMKVEDVNFDLML